MADEIKQGDFVEIDFVGKLKETGDIVDTNIRSVAQENGILNPQGNYETVIACIGSQQLLPGIDEGLVGKITGSSYTFDLKPEFGFGRKNPKLIQLIALSKFTSQNIEPMAGLQVEVDGMLGIVRSVTGGRVIVDFNHPLSGKAVIYEVTVKRMITDDKEKLHAVLEKHLGMKNFTIDIKDSYAKVIVEKEIPPPLGQTIGLQIVRMIPALKKVDFVNKEVEKKQETTA
ncbi:MAG: peptidylprolyl isomerase [Nanoarchaeota archaeon]|nr:MAG: peptidylprolyl isomerase [Nanoarchaeota archaeon]